VKINFKLLAIILTVEILYFYVMRFALILHFFLYYGSGAGSESQIAITSEKVATFIFILPPIIFNLYKIYKLKKEQKIKDLNSYLVSLIIYCLFITYQINKGYISL